MFIRKNRCCCCISSDIEKLHAKTKRVKAIMDDGGEYRRMLDEHRKNMDDLFKKWREANKAFDKKDKDDSIDANEAHRAAQARFLKIMNG